MSTDRRLPNCVDDDRGGDDDDGADDDGAGDVDSEVWVLWRPRSCPPLPPPALSPSCPEISHTTPPFLTMYISVPTSLRRITWQPGSKSLIFTEAAKVAKFASLKPSRSEIFFRVSFTSEIFTACCLATIRRNLVRPSAYTTTAAAAEGPASLKVPSNTRRGTRRVAARGPLWMSANSPKEWPASRRVLPCTVADFPSMTISNSPDCTT
mmetsp:Transcript_26130/g.53521  ORF Transcript_26130/g.53521 Transcript_26130/m.53521 type:complete len:209 (-) Transcript_26130:454-1080(-)